MLFDSEIDAFQVGLPVLGATGLLTALIVVATVTIAMKIRKQRVTTGIETIVGQHGLALSDITDNGQVRIGGEIWRANAGATIPVGTTVKVTAVNGMVVTVEPVQAP
jgi:membrane-bound serine protease (ClpP class)